VDLAKHSSFARQYLSASVDIEFLGLNEDIVTNCEKLLIKVSLPVGTTGVQALPDALEIARPHELILLGNPVTNLR
jgi:hypothetical protein